MRIDGNVDVMQCFASVMWDSSHRRPTFIFGCDFFLFLTSKIPRDGYLFFGRGGNDFETFCLVTW